jgi:hypothetical protein
MRRNLAFGGPARQELNRGICSVACLAFVGLLSLAFWAGALWIGQILLQVIKAGF